MSKSQRDGSALRSMKTFPLGKLVLLSHGHAHWYFSALSTLNLEFDALEPINRCREHQKVGD